MPDPFAEAPDPMLHGPTALPGQRIGLLGGSFDPPHPGHAHITRWALKGFGLDRVWWLVSPGNPLKPAAPADLDRRLAAARRLMRHPRVAVTDLEAALGTRYTAETLAALQRRYPGVRFVWLMGADNLASFHRWDRWTEIMDRVPVGVLARPGDQLRAGLSTTARRYARWRLQPHAARTLPGAETPAWALLTGRMLDLSSTALRARGAWPR
jgi:nicotinate-nucleotide adenylyltransferase